MIKNVKRLIKLWLRSKGYHLSWREPRQPAGISIFEDLRLLIPKSNPFVIDIGANEGQTIDAVLEMFPDASISAFEPTKRLCDELKARMQNPTVLIHQMGVSRSDGRAMLNIYDKSVFNSFLTLSPSPEHSLPDVRHITSEEIGLRSLDSLALEHNYQRIDLLKIDTQGGDLDVLLGGESLLAQGQINVVMVELNFFQMYEGEGSAISIIQLLLKNGYHLVDLYEKNRAQNCITWCTGLFMRSGDKTDHPA